MLAFENDYSEGAHPRILQRLLDTNFCKLPGYGFDEICDSAKEKIRIACESPKSDVFFLVGGTQTNQVVIASMLRPFEGVLSAVTGHVNGHEGGAIEISGHKVLAIPEKLGKIDISALESYLSDFYANDSHDHMVFPGMLYISHPTEYGSLYTLTELNDLRAICDRYEIPMFLDGARLGYGLAVESGDLPTLPDLARLCDVFYIGGTKLGALCGEAVVFAPGKMPAHFFTMAKQRGAILAKGRLLGIQFDELFTDNLYLELGKNAICTASRLVEILRSKGYEFFISPSDAPTNQIFVILSDSQMERLSREVRFCFWEKLSDGRSVVRFATSWATTDSDLDALEKIL